MKLTQPEIIQILRKRAGFNQAELGSRAFETTPNSGRTKIKNIELGRQLATDDDLKRIAGCLDVPVERLQPVLEENEARNGNKVQFSPKLVDMFPDFCKYLDMLDKAAEIDDTDLIRYLANRIAASLKNDAAADSSLKDEPISNAQGRFDRG